MKVYKNQFSGECVIVVPIYKNIFSNEELISFHRILKVFDSRVIAVICPKSLDVEPIKKLTKSKEILYETFEDYYFSNTHSYNRLLISNFFYERFLKYKYILICQIDVFVIKDDLNYWMSKKYDNIGAPIFEGYVNPTLKMKKYGANGGFCLRNVYSCLTVLNSTGFVYSKINTLWNMESKLYWKIFRVLRDGFIFNFKLSLLRPIINEDVYWSIIVPARFSWFNNCKSDVAKFFAFDANPSYLYKLCDYKYPMAIHAWWRYDRKFVEDIIAEYL